MSKQSEQSVENMLNDNFSVRLKKIEMLELLCMYKYVKTQQNLKERFKFW